MCLSIPSKVVKIDKENNMATVDTMGVKREASLDLMGEDDVKLGDYVLLHIGFIMNKIDEEDALLSIETYKEIIEAMDEDQGELSEAQERDHQGGDRRNAILEDDECENRGA